MKKFIKYFFIFTFVIGSLLLSFAYASYNQNDIVFTDISFNGTREQALQNAWDIVGYSWVQENAVSADNQTALINVLYNYDYFICYHLLNGGMRVYLSNQNNFTGFCYNSSFYSVPNGGMQFSTLNSSNSGYSVNIKTTTVDYALFYYNGQYKEYSANNSTIVTDHFEFNPVHSQIVNTSSGYLGVHAYKYDYSSRDWRLGIISEYLPDYPIYHMILYNQLYVSGDDVIAEGYYNNITISNTSSDLFVFNNQVFIKSRLLRYNVVYTLMIYPELSNGSFSSDNYQGTFIFLPLDSSISGDAIVDAGSGGYTQQDSTNDILNTLTDTSDLEDALSTSTFDENSGDIATAMGYTDFDNPFYDFIIGVWDEILDLFEASPNNQQLSFTIHGNTYTVQSDDYMIPDSNPLKIFVSSALTVGCIFLIYQYFAKIIYALTCLDIQGVMKGTDVDMSIFM